MRIEPPAKILPRQSSNRRPRPDALNPLIIQAGETVADKTTTGRNDATAGKIKNNNFVTANQPQSDVRRVVSSKRWRSYVPFIAHYIGQETASETPQRATRRHPELAGKAYKKPASRAPSPRTVAQV